MAYGINWGEYDLFTKEERQKQESNRIDILENTVADVYNKTNTVDSTLSRLSERFDSELLKRTEEKVVAEDTIEEELETAQVPEKIETEIIDNEQVIEYTDGESEEL